MIDNSLAPVIEKLTTNGFAFLTIAARFLGAMSIFPVLASNFFSKLVKVLLALSFSLVIFPSLNTTAIHDASNIVKFFFIFKEYFVGFVVGFVLAIPIWVITGVGQFIDNQRGESMGALVSPMTGVSSSSTGALLVQSFTVYFISMNGLIFFVGIVYKSFNIYPAGQFLPVIDAHMVGNYIELFKALVTWVILLAMPVVVLMFIVEAVLGLLSTFLPQMNVTVLSLPIKSCVGIFVLILYINNLYQFIMGHFLDKIKGVYV
ncbi:MAG: type III secretion system export apparatus subunit SctT [Bdellovibrionota bacterium]